MQAVEDIATTTPIEEKRPNIHGSVLFVTHSFPPSMEIGANSCAQVARYLPLYGWAPVVLTIEDKFIADEYKPQAGKTQDVSFAKAIVKTGVLPHPFGLYRWLKSLFSKTSKSSDEPDGESGSGGNFPSQRKGGLRASLVSLLTIPDMHIGWLIPAVSGGLKAIKENNCQVIFSSAPCFTGHLVGYSLKRLTGLPWIAHFRDPWLTAHQPGWFLPKAAIVANRKLEQMVMKRADHVVSVTEGHSVKLREAYSQYPPDKFSFIPNGFDSAEWTEIDRERINNARKLKPADKKFTILYAGQLYAQRNPLPLFKALQTLIESGEIERDRLQVDLVGWCDTSGDRSVPDLIAEAELQDCVNIVGPRTRQETLRRMTEADLLLLLAENLTIQIPGKTYEYLKAGTPILAFTSEGALSNLIRSTGCGWSVDPSDQEGIVKALRECYSDWKIGKVSHVSDPETVNRFDRRTTTGQMAKLFDQLSE
jgi:glycosyltransferase involved in cell wall biosynthesis